MLLLSNRLKNITYSFLMAAALLSLSLILPTSASAQGTVAWSGVCVSEETMTNVETGVTSTANIATIQGIQCIIANGLSLAVSALGLTGFVMFIVGAFTYLLSGGNSKGIESSKTTFTYAVVGLVVALSAVIILNVIAAFTGVDTILNFSIPNSDCGLNVEC